MRTTSLPGQGQGGSAERRAAIKRLIVTHVAALTGCDPGLVDPAERFRRHGLDSLGATRLMIALAEDLDLPLATTLAWEYPTVDLLANQLADPAAREVKPRQSRDPRPADAPVAIVGMACRLPGARNPQEYWQLLRDGSNAVTGLPADRWPDAERDLYDPDAAAPGKISTRWGGFLDRIDEFDPLFFGISPREAVALDPQQRLMLELSWEALEDAGVPPTALRASRTGVFFGAMWSDYARLTAGSLAQLTEHSATGQDTSIIAGRVSYTLGLRGPSVVFNTACSSSLVAVHYARQSVLRGESSLAIAGGVSIIAALDSIVAMSRFGAMSPDGRCRSFDAGANGYVRGEGGGVVVLKPLADALVDGDRIYCVLRGSAVNNDGFSNGMTAPSPEAQRMVLADAYADAAVDPRLVGYVETHGTGTVLGDPIEAEALGAVLGRDRPPTQPLLIGSAKSNLGHLEAAAGIAGLIKTALAVYNAEIPPSLHFEHPNPRIPFDQLGLAVPGTTRSWPAGVERRVAGVSSFGFGGTNCHVVVEQHGQDLELFMVAADAENALRARVMRVRDECRGQAGARPLRELCAAQPTVGGHRLAVSAAGLDQLADRLDDHLGGREVPGLKVSSVQDAGTGPVFVFAGQGSQWLGMGVELLDEPAFRTALVACDEALRPYLGESLVDKLAARDPEVVERTGWAQPAIFAVQVALAALWMSWGIRPSAVVGQSMGEIAAAHVAGALSLADAARAIQLRSSLATRLNGQGAMAVVELSPEDTRRRLPTDDISVVISSSPRSCVVSGDPRALAEFLARLANAGVAAWQIKVDFASHCRLVDSVLPDLRASLRGIIPRSADIPFYSTVTGGRLVGTELDADYWCRNLREPVLFLETVRQLETAGHRTFVDVNPHPVVVRNIEDCVADGVVVSSMRRDEPSRAMMLESLARLFVSGVRVARPVASAVGHPPDVLPLSAHSAAALRQLAGEVATFLAEGRAPRADVCYTASARRTHQRHRLAVCGESSQELADSLTVFAAGGEPAGLVSGVAGREPRQVAFVFPGQGGQWAGMCRDLVVGPRTGSVGAEVGTAFRERIEECDAAIRQESGLSVLGLLRGADERWLDRPDQVQPALFAVSLALAAAWQSFGVTPSHVVGHSMGEVAMACFAGALSLADAARLICRRSEILAGIAGRGGMVLVELTLEQSLDAIAGHTDRVAVAAVNGPRSTVLTGDLDALASVLAGIESHGVFHRWIKVAAAAHSPQVDALLPGFQVSIETIRPAAGHVTMWSTVTGEPCQGTDLGAEYWVRNLRQPVRFASVVGAIEAAGPTIFVELGPQPVLTTAIGEIAGQRSHVVGSMRHGIGGRRALTEALGAVYPQGVDIDWARCYPNAGRVASLPTYPWQRDRHWITDPPARSTTPPPVRTQAPREEILAAGARRLDKTERYLTEQVARILRMPAKAVPAGRRLAELGLDSLMAAELRNRVISELRVDLSVSLLLRGGGVAELARDVLVRLDTGEWRGGAAGALDLLEHGEI